MRKGETRMKPTQAFILATTSAIFLLTFFVASGIPTGLLVNENLELSITGEKAYDTSAIVTWSTSTDAISTIVVDGKSTAFEASTRFSRQVTGLRPGTKYDFAIRACNEKECTEKTGSLTTKGAAERAAITGAITGGNGITQIIKTSVNLILYSLLAVTLTIIIGKVGYEQLVTNRDPMEGLIKKANRHIEEDNYGDAHQAYTAAREAFKQLEENAKVKHYDALLNIYHSLKRYATINEAQRLAEKYENGTITREEIRRLSELLAN